ncbi:LicD family protein [Chitinophaga ginsengisegetis]|uniref:LicD family protein n=1 Tax=Chitinophaga ginsengisegetis TaxID=393003 RepID=UPI000DBFE294|nr:LicD family protein [Chitinophaga ginsengisegetis]MDR6568204.1 hypothetical protein [Chitinophaga ginsengisegetis]MDR6647241.1 hypothetical protein [Chitinophaga ginsengisegetis]MDR6653590.1 hypothetical protein [Chitinophaga ginsengisegetis]
MKIYLIAFNKGGQYGLSPVDTILKNKQDINNNDIEIVPFKAIDGHDPGISVDLPLLKQQHCIELSKERIDLFFNHREVWKAFLGSPYEYCLIVEDKGQIVAPLTEMASFIGKLPDGWDIFFPFEKTDNANPPAPYEVREYGYLGTTILMELYWGGSFYFISKPGADKLLKISKIPEEIPANPAEIPKEKILSALFCATSWFKLTPTALAERDEMLRTTILNFNRWDPDNLELVRVLLKLTSAAAKKNNIDLILHGGSLLGYIRHGGIIPWDDDIDIGIENSRLDQFLETLSSVPGLEFERLIEERTGIPYYKLWLRDGQPIDNYKYTFPFIDVWLYDAYSDDIFFHNGFTFLNGLKAPLQEVFFEGAAYKIPHNPIECLDSMYKDWKESIRIYTWSHRLEATANFPLQMEIQVDASGRMI